MHNLIVVDNPDRWPLKIPGVALVSARKYLTDPSWTELRHVTVFNLCRSYAYQSLGYYVSILAEARGHKPQPSVLTLQDLKLQAVVRIVSDDLADVMERALAQVQSPHFTLSIYFGRPLVKRHRTLALALFNHFQAPLLRARFAREEDGWYLQSVGPIAAKEIPPSHHDFVIQAAAEYFTCRPRSSRRRAEARFELAMLVDPQEKLPPSDAGALDRFEKAAGRLGFALERITRDDYGRLAEFDALFIRATTAVDHYTYRFARRAQAEGLVVIDDPRSIVRASNKVYLAELLGRHDVPTPRTIIVHEKNRDGLVEALGFPIVLKQPDSSFSVGVVKVHDEESLQRELDRLLDMSDLVIAQEFVKTDFDWRVGVLDRKPLYACRYFMARHHWQILKHGKPGVVTSGKVETLAIEDAPKNVLRAAVRAAGLIGDGLYGVDLKQSGRNCTIIEVNDNPSLDAGYEDKILKKELYERIMAVFLERIESSKQGAQTVSEEQLRARRLRLFEGYGIELEYMIVDRETLDVRPLADELLRAAAGGAEYVSDVELGDTAWSNELALHVIELKTNGPAARLEGLPEVFGASLALAAERLAPLGAQLLPTAMHPWMDPLREMHIWPHECSPIYAAYDRIFDCRGHGWANLQSMHFNLPFADDDELDRLHSAIRLVLPILPALAASSPIAEGHPTGLLDTRLEYYRMNSVRVPSICARVIPEAVATRAEYEELILGSIYRDLEPLDPEGVLRHEFANARGAIARFDRYAVEIRVIDVQEAPQADLAIAALVARVLRALVEERWSERVAQRALAVDPLAELFVECIREGERTRVRDEAYLCALGQGGAEATAGELWARFAGELVAADDPWREALDVILDEGPLARRILRATGSAPSRGRLTGVYRELADCLAAGRLFRG